MASNSSKRPGQFQEPSAAAWSLLGSDEWPSNCYRSVELLMAMFLQNTSPFADWKAPGVQLSDEVADTAQLGVDTLLLELWFLGFGRRFGEAAAHAAKDALTLRLEKVSAQGAGLSRTLQRVMPLHGQAYADYYNMNPASRTRMMGGVILEPDPEYFVATYFLTHLVTSPYFAVDEANLGLDGVRLSECLTHAAGLARSYFIPMLGALESFDSDDFPEWRWSAAPGYHEQLLRARHDEPLRGATGCVSSEEVYVARMRDIDLAEATSAATKRPLC